MTAPLIVVTGIKGSGLNLIASMLFAGGIDGAESPEASSSEAVGQQISGPGYIFTLDPHANAFDRPACRTVGLFVSRPTDNHVAAIKAFAASENRALDNFETLTLRSSLIRDRRRARDVAASLFGPVYELHFDRILSHPHDEAQRLARILSADYPEFDSLKAALAVRRIRRVPKLITAICTPVSIQREKWASSSEAVGRNEEAPA